ncbi:MAG: GntR family transcriptional regulator, partial [Chloroflexota bacterium]
DKHPRYRQIAEHLRRQIAAGAYRAGDRLPTEMEAARLYGVSRVTTAAALNELARDGLVDRTPRRGTIVRPLSGGDSPPGRPLIACIQPDTAYWLANQLLRGIESGAREAGFNLLFHLAGTSREEEERAIRQALDAGARGIVLHLQDGETYNAEVLRLVLDGYPVVLVDRYLRGVPCASVQCDNIAAARSVVEELVNAGHRQVCALAYPSKGTSAIEDRLEGYSQALAAAGISLDRSLIYTEERLRDLPEPWEMPDEIVERFAAYLRVHPRVTALFATNAGVGLVAIRAADRLGLRVPDDLSIVGIDPVEAFPISIRAITCAIQPGEAIGRAAIDLIREGLEGKPARRVLLPTHIERADSVSAPKPMD